MVEPCAAWIWHVFGSGWVGPWELAFCRGWTRNMFSGLAFCSARYAFYFSWLGCKKCPKVIWYGVQSLLMFNCLIIFCFFVIVLSLSWFDCDMKIMLYNCLIFFVFIVLVCPVVSAKNSNLSKMMMFQVWLTEGWLVGGPLRCLVGGSRWVNGVYLD